MANGDIPKSIKASLYIDGKPAENSIKDVSQVARSLKRDLDQLTYGTEAFTKKAEELKKVTAYLSEMKEEASGMGDQFMKVKATLTDLVESVAIGTLISQAIRGALEGIKEFISGVEKAYEDATAVQVAITNKLKQTGMVAGETGEALKKYSETLSEQTGIEDVVIQKGEDMLLTYTNIRGYIYKEALPAALNLAAAENNGRVTMENVSASAEKLAKALEKPTEAKKELKQMGIDLTNQQEQEIKSLNNSNQMQKAQQIILDEVNKRFGNLNKTMNDSALGPAQRFDNQMNKLSENLGRIWQQGKNVSDDVLEPFVEWMAKITSENVPAKLQEEQDSLNALVGAIVSTNNSQAIRNELIDELQAKYPDFIGNINKETATNDLLLQKLAKVNDEYRTRIFIAANEDKIKDIQETRNKAIREEAAARDRVARASGRSAVELAKLNDAQVKALALSIAEKKAASNVGFGPSYQTTQAQHDADVIINGRKAIDQSFKDEGELMNANAVYQKKVTAAQVANIDEQIAALKKKIATEKEADKVTDEAELKRLQTQRDTILGKVTAPTSGPTQAEIDEAKRKYDELMKARAAYIERSKELTNQEAAFLATELADTMAKNDKEVKALQNKYDAEIAKEQEFIRKSYDAKGKLNKDANQGEVDKHSAQIDDLRAKRDKATNDLIEKQHKDLDARLADFLDKIADRQKSEYQKQLEEIQKFYDAQRDIVGKSYGDLEKIEADRQQAIHLAKLNQEKTFQEELAKIRKSGEDALDKDTDTPDGKLKKIKQEAAQERALKLQEYQDGKIDAGQYQDALFTINQASDDKIQALQDEQRKKEIDKQFQAYQDVANAIFTISNRDRAADTNAKIQELEKQKSAELSNKNLTETQRQAIDKKYQEQESEAKRKQFEADKAAAAEQALINGALAYMKLFVTYPGGFADPLFDVAAIQLDLATTAQEAVILSQPTPAFAEGGSTNPAGFVNRATIFRSPASGNRFMAGEAGSEWIAPNWMVQSPRYSNIIGMLEGARQQKTGYAMGGYNGGGQTPQNDNSGQIAAMQAMIAAHTVLFEKQAAINEIPVVNNYRTQEIFAAKLVAIRAAANGGG